MWLVVPHREGTIPDNEGNQVNEKGEQELRMPGQAQLWSMVSSSGMDPRVDGPRHWEKYTV